MKIAAFLTTVAGIVSVSNAFSLLPQQNALKTSTTLSMGLFDFFSEEAKQKRELKRRLEIEEQERLQKAIMERRRNPDLMEEYEAKVQYRRELRMMGDDEGAEKVELYEDLNKQTLLDGTTGSDNK